MKFGQSSLAATLVMSFLLTSCGNNDSSAPKVQAAHQVNNDLKLKELSTGVNINTLKKFGLKKLSNTESYFDYQYFGSKAITNVNYAKDGTIYEYKMLLDEPLDKIKSALEAKLSEENGRPVKFLCKTEKYKPDSSAEITDEKCRVENGKQSMVINQFTMQPTEKYMGLPRLPKISLSIQLIDKDIKDKTMAEQNMKSAEAEKDKYKKKGSDI